MSYSSVTWWDSSPVAFLSYTTDGGDPYKRDLQKRYKRDLQKRPTKETHEMSHSSVTWWDSSQKKLTKEPYKRDLQKRPTKETRKRDSWNVTFIRHMMRLITKETHKRALQKRPTKETYKRDPQKRLMKCHIHPSHDETHHPSHFWVIPQMEEIRLKIIPTATISTSFQRNPSNFQTRFHGSPNNFKQFFMWVNGSPRHSKEWPGTPANLETQIL